MARTSQGKGFRAVPVLTRGLTDRVWVRGGEVRKVDGCYFQVVGTVEKTRGVRNLVDWSPLAFHLLNTRINAMTSFQVRGGPEELVISLSGDTGLAANVEPSLGPLLLSGGKTKDKYRGGRILVVRGDRVEHPQMPHIGLGSPWQGRFSGGDRGDQFIDGRRVEPEDQYGGDYFASWAGWLFAVNGVDANIKWNGSYASLVGVQERPSPPKATKLTLTSLHRDFSIGDEWAGAGDADRGNELNVVQKFQYRCTFVNSSGAEGPPSEPGEFVTTGEKYMGATKLTGETGLVPSENVGDWIQEDEASLDPGDGGTLLSAMPYRALIEIRGLGVPKQQDLVWRNIYKRARDGEYYFWRQVAVNERVVVDHEDTLQSASMGTLLSEGLTAPPTSKFCAFFRGRGYYVPSEFPSFIFYSDSGLPEQMSSALQYLDVSSTDGTSITGLFTFADSLVVFKENSVWQITALADGSPVLTPVDESIGSVSPRASVLAYERLVFVGTQGVYQFDGASIRPLSESLNEWWRNVYGAGLRTATSWLDERERRLFISLQSGPDELNDMVVCYHYQLDAVTVIKGQRITASTAYKGESLLGVRLPAKEEPGKIGSIKNSDIIIWGLGDSFSYDYLPGFTGRSSDEKDEVTVGSIAGRIRFGPYSSVETGWNSDEQMEVSGIDLFFPYAGDQELTVRWFKDRDPISAGSRTVSLNKYGKSAQKTENDDLTTLPGWSVSASASDHRYWGTDTWRGRRQLFQRITFPETVVCREIEIEFENGNEKEPYMLDGFVLWRVSKGAERQR